MPRESFFFKSVRKDWYHSNQTLPRMARACLSRKKNLVFDGFPRQWIPFFEWYGIAWRNSTPPEEYLPFFSDFGEEAIVSVVTRARENQSLRILVESVSMLDPVLVDFLYNVDHTTDERSPAMRAEIAEMISNSPDSRRRPLVLTGWQSYGRPSVRLLEQALLQVKPKAPVAVVLPCSVTRPYDRSYTHKKMYRVIREAGYEIQNLHRIVFTSLGVLPEELWSMPQVMKYDARVPDIYRILRLSRAYFSNAKYQSVLDCQNFRPYSDLLRIMERERTIARLVPLKVPGKGHFHVR